MIFLTIGRFYFPAKNFKFVSEFQISPPFSALQTISKPLEIQNWVLHLCHAAEDDLSSDEKASLALCDGWLSSPTTTQVFLCLKAFLKQSKSLRFLTKIPSLALFPKKLLPRLGLTHNSDRLHSLADVAWQYKTPVTGVAMTILIESLNRK